MHILAQMVAIRSKANSLCCTLYRLILHSIGIFELFLFFLLCSSVNRKQSRKRKWTKYDVVSLVWRVVLLWTILMHDAQLESWMHHIYNLILIHDAQVWAIFHLQHQAKNRGLSHIVPYRCLHSIEWYIDGWYTALNYTDAWCTSLSCGCTASSHIDAWCTATLTPDAQHWVTITHARCNDIEPYWCLFHSIELYWCLMHSIEPHWCLMHSIEPAWYK